MNQATHSGNRKLAILGGIALLSLLIVASLRDSDDDSQRSHLTPNSAQEPSSPSSDPAKSEILGQIPNARHIQSSQEEQTNTEFSSEDRSPEQRLTDLANVADPKQRAAALAALATELNESDPNTADELVHKLWTRPTPAGNKTMDFVKALTKERFNQNREAAIAWADALPNEARALAYQSIATTWASTDSIAATEWALGIPDPSVSQHMVYTIGAELEAGQHIDAGGAWAEHLSQFDVAPRHATQIGTLWGRADVQSAFDWASTIPDPEPKKQAFVGIAQAVAGLSPEVAKEWIKVFPEEHGIQADAGLGAFYKQPFDTLQETADYIYGNDTQPQAVETPEP